LGDVYVNEAFSNSHRAHASIVGIPKFIPVFAGFGLEREVLNLSKAFNPPHPFLFILGGAKFETKMPLVEKFLNIADDVFVGGALANDIYKAKGLNVGKSVVSDGEVDLNNFINNPKILVPIDIETDAHHIKNPEEVTDEEKIYDAGPKTVEILGEKIKNAKFVLWNGPLGDYEKGFVSGTQGVAKALGETEGVEIIIGGGDTLASIKDLGIKKEFSFLSTAGGAMLEFLANGTLPGIEALK
jgi:phosphoglycerate kinase